METGLQVVVLGIGVVLLVLSILIICVTLMSKMTNREKAIKNVISSTPQLTTSVVEDDKNIIAVIMASIYAILSNELETTADIDFIVRSIKRV